jgi:hypothetical protein
LSNGIGELKNIFDEIANIDLKDEFIFHDLYSMISSSQLPLFLNLKGDYPHGIRASYRELKTKP